MNITKAILHIIDREAGTLICSQQLLKREEYPVKVYLESIVKRLGKTEYKTGRLDEASEFYQLMNDETISFEEKSCQVAQMVVDRLAISEDAPSGDLLIVELQEESGKLKWGMIKFNYKPSFTHHVTYQEDKMQNNIILNKAIFPSVTSKIEECCLVDLDTFSVEIVEKKYQFEDQKKWFFTERLLDIVPDTTINDNLKIIKKTIKEVANRYNEEEYVSMSRTQQAVYESIEEEGVINPEKVAENVFLDNESAKEAYFDLLNQTLFTKEIQADKKTYEKKYSKQKFKLTNGIEISIPSSVFNDKDLVEFINNPDGTISVIIKNVEDVISKF